MAHETIHIRIISPEEKIFEGNVLSITCENEKGVFDVLPLHGNFMSLLKNKIVIQIDQENSKEIPVEKGLIQVLHNDIFILINVEGAEKEIAEHTTH